MKRLLVISLIICALLPTNGKKKEKKSQATTPKQEQRLSDNDMRRYQYFYLEAIRQEGLGNYPEAFDLLKDYVVYMHIKDAFADGTVVPAGYGLGHVEDILRVLSERGFEGFLSLEPHLGTFKGLEFLEIRSSIGEAKEQSTAETFDIAYNALMDILGKAE